MSEWKPEPDSKCANADANFVRWIASPRGLGGNDSVRALMDDGSQLKTVCPHGGSGYVCKSCGERMLGLVTAGGW